MGVLQSGRQFASGAQLPHPVLHLPYLSCSRPFTSLRGSPLESSLLNPEPRTLNPAPRPPSPVPDASPASLAPPHIRALRAYTPGLQPKEPGWIKLNTNENPYPPSSAVAAAVAREAGANLRLYPDPRSTALRQAFARHYGLAEENVLVGNGSDDVLNLLVRVFGGVGSAVGFTNPSYSLYPVLVAIENGACRPVEFTREMRLPVAELARSPASIVFLTSPNAPTGVGFATAQIEELAAAFPGMLVVDEAYADFAEENALGLLARFPRLVVARTLSKSFALAGLRVGCALGHPEVIDLLDRVRDSYNVNRLSQAGAIAALGDRAWFDDVIPRIKATRAAAQAALARLGWFTYPSQSNFLFTEPRTADGRTGADVARACYDFLLSRKILVRYFGSHSLTRSFLRITVGTDSQMEALFGATQTWLNHA
jgi:histidinol-phosphate aminotransferase